MSDIFPIQNNSACALKWGWNTFRLYNGTSSSCHRVKPEFVPIDQFENFHNMPKVLEDRALMRQGEWPKGRGCEYCQDVEKQHGLSDRLYHNQIPNQHPVNFGESDYVIPSLCEVYLDNVCDLACIYCQPFFSSRINDELKKFGPTIVGLDYTPKLVNSDQYFNRYLEWLDQNVQHLTRLAIQGGEPMLQKNLWKILDFLKEKVNPNLEISINTNLNAPTEKIQQYVETVKELLVNRSIKRADVQISLDCWGPQQEFIRYGVNLDQWEKNFEYLIKHKWLRLSIHQVLTSLSIKTTNEFQSKIVSWKKINPSIVQDYFVVDGVNLITLHPEIFGQEFFSQQLHDIANNFICATDQDNLYKNKLLGLVNTLLSGSIDPVRLKKLQLTLDQTDQRRNTNWRELWPEIDQFFHEQNINV